MRKNNFKYIFVALFIFIFSDTRTEIKAIIFDFGGVLGRTSEMKFAKEVGLQDLMALGLKDILSLDFSNLGLKEKVLEIMSELEPQIKAENGLVSRHDEIELPEIMCKWFRGEISGADANAKVQSYLEDLSQFSNKIKNETEKRILSNIIRIMFDEQKLAEFTEPINETLNILGELEKEKNYKLLILSNWSAESFNNLYKSERMSKVFQYFNIEDIFISGCKGVIKPSNLAYQNILDHISSSYKILPEECLIIDDQPENIIAAACCKMQGILVDKNCNNLRSELVKLNVLKEKQSWISNLVPFNWN